MTAVKLETFALESGGLSRLQSPLTDTLERARNESYANGFKDGVKVTRDALNAEQTRLLAAISEAISDARISREEASALAVRGLRPVIDALLSHLAPRLAETRFADAVVEAVSHARKSDEGCDMRLRVSPGQVSRLREEISSQPYGVELVADDSLSDLQARIDWADGSDNIDFDRFLSDLDTLRTEFHALTEESTDGRSTDVG